MADEPRDLRSWLATLELLRRPFPDVSDDDLLPLDEPDVRIDEPDGWRLPATTTVRP